MGGKSWDDETPTAEFLTDLIAHAKQAILWGGNPIILIGFDMRGTHFFGEHERPLKQMRKSFDGWIKQFRDAADMLPPGLRIINATPKSALDCFERMTLAEALNETRQAR